MTDGPFVLALDQGTTSSRAIVFDASGGQRAVGQRPTTQLFPQSGWVNQDATELWETTLAAAREAVDAVGIGVAGISAIGITNQRETTILWDRRTGEPLAPAVVWQSRQSAPIVDDLVRRGMAPTYQATTGLVPDAYFSATKIAWLLDDDPALRRRAEAGEVCFGTVDSWLVWKLTNGARHLIDVSNAARTMLYDIHRGEWADELLADLAIPRAMLPEVVASSGALAESSVDVLGASIPIAGIAGDQQAALFGQACHSPGTAKNTYGTGSFLLMNTGRDATESRHRLLTTIAWQIGGETTYALEGAIFVTGSAVQWLRDGLGLIPDATAIEPLAASVPDTGGVVFVPALTGLGAPYWDQAARGTIVGITRGTTAAHVARATLEAIALQTRDVLDAMSADSGIALAELRVDGGASRNDLLMQMQADMLGVPVVRPTHVESTALGAAYLAGLGVGVWSSLAQIADQWRVDRVFEPTWSRDRRDERHAEWQRAVERAHGWASTPD